MATVSKGRNASKEGSIGKKRRPGLSESDDNPSKGNALYGKKNCELPFSKIYNSSMKSHVPAELFRKDLISAMKLADTEQLSPDDYWLISDTWKQEWEKGVQVPVNPDRLPETNVRVLNERKKPSDKKHFKQPRKLIKFSEDANYSPDIHILTNAPVQHLKVCSYDLDILDNEWLKIMNEELKLIGLPCLTESTMELAMEKIENQCFYKLQEAIKTEEGLGIEYDDDVICDVCRSPDSEEGNEMVFCDACNVCVHQACYGITKIPEGSWVCRSCALGIRPPCILCPNVGGAMKSTRSGQKWTHVSCALWIPEVAIENVDKMEPITKISEIPASRWALVCSLCRDKVGACIQCSVRTCKTAYHVTCAFQYGLAMKAIIDDDEEEDDVDLKSYCLKHTNEKKGILSEELGDNSNTKNKKKELEMSNEEKASARLARIKQMEAEFYRYVNIKEVARSLRLDVALVDFIYQYWILKRKANFNKPLVIPKSKPPEPVESKPVNSLYARMKMFVHLRQDLERVRNLCYMVTKRERLSRSWCRIKRDIFLKQAEIISSDYSLSCKETEKQAILNANHGDTVYDIMTSCNTSSNPSLNSILSALGEKISPRKEHSATSKHRKSSSSSSPLQRLPNPYAKQYLNSVLKRSQRSSTESYTEQDAKWKAMSENEKTSHQKSKDIANKFAALQETYKLKPMEIVVDKLPDRDTCLKAPKFCKRTNISPNKRSSRSNGSIDKLHYEPLSKKAKLRFNSQTKATKTETKENILSQTNTKVSTQTSVHNTRDHQRDHRQEKDQVIHNIEKELFNSEKEDEPQLSSSDSKYEVYEHNEKDSLLCGKKEKHVSIQMKKVPEINNLHYEQNNHIAHEENKEKLNKEEEQGEKDYFKTKIDKNPEDREHSHRKDSKEDVLPDSQEKSGNLTDLKSESSNTVQEEKGHAAHKENESEVALAVNFGKNELITPHKNDVLYSDESENAFHTREHEVVDNKQTQCDKNKVRYHKKEDECIAHRKSHSKSGINHKEDVDVCVNPKLNDSKLNNNHEHEKPKKNDIANEKLKQDNTSFVSNINDLDHKVDKKLDNHKKDENKINYHKKQKNDHNHKKENEVETNWKAEIGFNNGETWETQFSSHKTNENHPYNYKVEHELLKDVTVSVQRYNGENIEEKTSPLSTKASNEIFMNSCMKVENNSPLDEKYEMLELSVNLIMEDAKDASSQDSLKSLSDDSAQAAISRSSDMNEQIVKSQVPKKLGSSANSQKLNYEQKLMNTKRLRKEDIIIPAKPFLENNRLQKSNEHTKPHSDDNKLSRREYKKQERLNKSPNVTKNTSKNLHQLNLKCNGRERTPSKKPESSLNSVKCLNKQFVKDLSRHNGLETELQKNNFKGKRLQIANEKLASETVTRENLSPVGSKEDHHKDVHNTNTASRSPNCSNSDTFNKKLSPKSNMHRYNNVPEKLHCSPTSSNHAQSSLTVPFNKDTKSGKEKLRQESAKIRESLFAVNTCTAKSLSGYKIPKKPRTDSIEKNSAQSSQDSCKMSPLYGVCQIPHTETYPHNGYHTDRNFRGCKYGPRIRNGEQRSQEQKLLFKLSKDPSSARWQGDSASSGRRDSFSVIQKNNSAFPPPDRNAHCDRSCASSSDNALLPIISDTGGYWVTEDSTGNFIKHFSQNIQNGLS